MPRRKLRLRLKKTQDATTPSETPSQSPTGTPVSTPQRRRPRSRSRSSPKKPPAPSSSQKDLEAMIDSHSKQFTYPGWQDDWKQFQSLQVKYSNDNDDDHPTTSSTIADWVLTSRMQGMIHKQQAFLGDRSHVFLKQLDALLPHLKDAGWPLDYQAALQAHYQHDNDWNRSRALFRLQQKQCVLHNRDRSHPRIVELDHIANRLSYPGHDRDIQLAQELHFQYADDYIGNNLLAKQFQALQNRQAHWDGQLKLPHLLETIQKSSTSYEGFQEDMQVAMEAHLHACSIDPSSGQVLDCATAIHHVQHKQALLQGDRSHPRLVKLDRILQKHQLPLAATAQQLMWQCEETHLRYASDDWIGNAIWDCLIRALKKELKQPQRLSSSIVQPVLPSTPLHKKHAKAVSPSSSTETTITASYSWSSGDEDEEEEEDYDGENVEEGTVGSI